MQSSSVLSSLPPSLCFVSGSSNQFLGTKNYKEKGFYFKERKEQEIGEHSLLQGLPIHKMLKLNLQKKLHTAPPPLLLSYLYLTSKSSN